MNSDYIRIAHRRAVWAELQRILLNEYVGSEGPAKKSILCEDVVYSEKDVSQEAIIEVIEELQRCEQDERSLMSQFEFRRRDARSRGSEEVPQAAQAQAAAATGGGSPSAAPGQGPQPRGDNG